MPHAANVTDPAERRGAEERRSGTDRRSGLDRRSGNERRARSELVDVERRSGRERRYTIRRSGLVRRQIVDRRGEYGRRARHELSAEDHARARRLPDAFLAARGSPAERVAEAVHHAWPDCPAAVRAGIAEALLPLLKPLGAAGAAPDDALRDRCEDVAARWLARVA